MHHRSETEAFRFVYSLLLIFLFLLAAIAYFFVYRHLVLPSRPETAVLTEQKVFAKSSLPLREDVARFLDVYFNQTDLTGEDKQRFVLAEYLRFARYSGDSESEQWLLSRFVSAVGQVVAKYENGETDFSMEEQTLAGLYQKIQ